MIKSMTGFSKVEETVGNVNIAVELKSLNGKNLELNFRMPKFLNEKEIELREIFRKSIFRGTLSIYINIEDKLAGENFSFNIEEARKIQDELLNLRKELKIKETIKIEHVLAYSEHFKDQSSNSEFTPEIWDATRKCVLKAIEELDSMRRKEGGNIARDLGRRLKFFTDQVKEIEKLGIERIPEEQERYKEKIARMFENDEIDEQRLQTEIVLMADKLDISEECVRLLSHLQLFNEYMRDKMPSGRKLNFLMQEIHREVNTIGSKSSYTKISHKVVNLKEDIERIREQVQNVE
jgi:uncharacterized protein (TIGR00255 family)